MHDTALAHGHALLLRTEHRGRAFLRSKLWVLHARAGAATIARAATTGARASSASATASAAPALRQARHV